MVRVAKYVMNFVILIEKVIKLQKYGIKMFLNMSTQLILNF